ncbi:MAG TPA: hypothetical protein VIV35_09845 [Chitinophagaceae bacterium]
MFSQVWKKYLPVIAILMKRSVNGDQSLSMNPSDFQRAAGGRKIKYSFTNLQLTNGRINNTVKHQPLAREFAVTLQEDEMIRKILPQKHFEFSMNNSFQLSIKNNTPPAETAPGENDETANKDDEVSLTATDVS